MGSSAELEAGRSLQSGWETVLAVVVDWTAEDLGRLDLGSAVAVRKDSDSDSAAA